MPKPPVKSEKATLSPKVSLRREVRKDDIDDPLQEGKETTSMVDRDKRPLTAKINYSSLNAKCQDEGISENDEEEVDEAYNFKFIEMDKRFEDVIHCHINLQEMHLLSKKQLCDLELKCDNANGSSRHK
ncbi:hypothetical protein Csa_017633 [Cucumis sativus]|nr:hypothetical protein Csa_017633 [Cucumis sativus]